MTVQFADNRAVTAEQNNLVEAINSSPKQVAQKQQFADAAQLQSADEEELQMKAAPGVVQRVGPEDKEPLQGKFETTQRVEDEELVQGKFSTEPVQQQGRVKPAMQMKQGVPVNDDAGLEKEADVMGGKALQMKSYNTPVTVSEVITSSDLNDWGVVRRKLSGIAKGGSADSTIAGNVNSSLTALGLATGNSSMSAHMIPNRAGGAGDDSNVRPWDRAFETGTWETDVEKKFNQNLVGVKVGGKVDYSVTTSDMSDDQAQAIIDKSTVDSVEKAKPEHKTSIKKIPLDVSANVGGDALGKTDECYKNLIK